MSMHIITSGASAAMGAAGIGMLGAAHAVSHDTWVLLVPAAISSMAAIGGFAVAAASYWKHRGDRSDLATHEEHDDKRFDRLERLFMGLPAEDEDG